MSPSITTCCGRIKANYRHFSELLHRILSLRISEKMRGGRSKHPAKQANLERPPLRAGSFHPKHGLGGGPSFPLAKAAKYRFDAGATLFRDEYEESSRPHMRSKSDLKYARRVRRPL